MTYTSLRFVATSALLWSIGFGCQVDDADLETSSLVSFTITPAANEVDVLRVDVSGSATLAYVSAGEATVEIFVNGASAYVESFDAAASRELAFETTLPLTEGTNEIVALLDYGDNQLSQNAVVTVADGLQAFTLTPAATAVNVYEVDVTADVALGFMSDDEATLEIAVNGRAVYLESIDASGSKTAQSKPTLPLSRLGPNDIVATLRYRGNELTERAIVTVDPAAPSVSFPAWTTAHTQQGTVSVSLDAEWTVDAVAFSRDGGEFLPATALGGGDFAVDLVDLDIGDNALTVRVTTSNRGTVQVHEFHDVVADIAPVFACNTPSAAMLPDTELLERNRFERRTMVGYFGDPDGGHTFAFVLSFEDDGIPMQTVGTVLSAARTSLLVEHDIDRADCGDAPCTQSYGLRLLVDDEPVALCSNGSFGLIRRTP